MIVGLLVIFTSEYFTSYSCPIAREVSDACKKGLPLNILRAYTFGNVATMIFILLLSILTLVLMQTGGALGLAFAGI